MGVARVKSRAKRLQGDRATDLSGAALAGGGAECRARSFRGAAAEGTAGRRLGMSRIGFRPNSCRILFLILGIRGSLRFDRPERPARARCGFVAGGAGENLETIVFSLGYGPNSLESFKTAKLKLGMAWISKG
jgi:hypothetical protein